MSLTIGDVIQSKKQTDQYEAQAKAAVEAAQKAYSEAQVAVGAAHAQLKMGLSQTGPAFVLNTDGTVEVWMPDTSDAGYLVLKPVPVATPVDLPSPAPSPAPGQ